VKWENGKRKFLTQRRQGAKLKQENLPDSKNLRGFAPLREISF
jgi:hypothetical protein